MTHQTTLDRAEINGKSAHEKNIISFKATGLSPFTVRLCGGTLPPGLPASFTVRSEVTNGNIGLNVSDVQYDSCTPHPAIWRINSTISDAERNITLVLEDSLGHLLVLTGYPSKDPYFVLEGTWDSGKIHRSGTHGTSKGKWAAHRHGESPSFVSEFSWNFLISKKSERQSVVMNFRVENVDGLVTLRQLSSFPEGWKVEKIGADGESLFMKLKDERKHETYLLQKGLFAGAFNSLVCQGIIAQNDPDGSDDPCAVLDDGTWTGTSGGTLP